MESSSRSRSPVVIFVAIAVIAWSVIGCKPPDKQAGPRKKITFAHTNSPNVALVHIAFAKGFFAEEGLDATPQPHAFGKLALDAVNEGKADFATPGDTPFVYSVMNGRKITALAVIETSNRNQGIIARKDRGIATPSDFLGKRVGFTPGSTSDYFLSSFLLYHGISNN